jgi:CubicO group peptidase (beta-lactamase class C family)
MITTWRRTTRPWILTASLVALAPLAVGAQEPFPGLDAYVNQTLATWHVPGVSIAIVRNDTVLYTKGYGVRAFGAAAPVDDHTLFEIGSSSKAFTATLVAMLVGDGKMRWDAHVTDYLPASGSTIRTPAPSSPSVTRSRTAAVWRAASSYGSAPASRATKCCIAFDTSSRRGDSARGSAIRT